jgi:hypothetical protein
MMTALDCQSCSAKSPKELIRRRRFRDASRSAGDLMVRREILKLKPRAAAKGCEK